MVSVNDNDRVDFLQRATGLDRGESEAIIIADKTKADLFLMDEIAGRRIAQNMKIPITGSACILVRAFQTGLISKEEADKLMAVYDSLEARKTVLHGDFHPKNIMYTQENDELFFIDLGDMGYGHPLLDLGSTCLVMEIFGRSTPERTPHYLGLDYETSLTLWENILSEYFGSENTKKAKILADIYGQAKFALFPVIIPGMPEKDIFGFLMGSRAKGFLNKDFDISPALNIDIDF